MTISTITKNTRRLIKSKAKANATKQAKLNSRVDAIIGKATRRLATAEKAALHRSYLAEMAKAARIEAKAKARQEAEERAAAEAIKAEYAKHKKKYDRLAKATMKLEARQRLTITRAEAEARAEYAKMVEDRAKAKAERKAKADRDGYDAVTYATAPSVAVKACYVALRTAYLAKARAVKRRGEVVAYDGNTGGDNKTYQLWNGVYNSAYAKSLGIKGNLADLEATAEAISQEEAETEEQMSAEELENLNEAISRYSFTNGNDTDDCILEAYAGMKAHLDEVGGIDDGFTFRAGLRAVHKYLNAMDSQTTARVRNRYDDDGNLLDSKVYKYTKYRHLWVDSILYDDDGNELEHQFVDVNNGIDAMLQTMTAESIFTDFAVNQLTDKQRAVFRLWAMGWTYESIGRALAEEVTVHEVKRVKPMSKGTIAEHIAAIKRKAEKCGLKQKAIEAGLWDAERLNLK